MRQPRNSLNKDTAEKPYNSENYDIMRKTTTNKQIEDIGGITKHSEFEKPYKLNWNEDYGNMQNLHPSNYDFSFLDTSSPNFENNIPNIPNIPSGGIGDKDICIQLLYDCQREGMFGTACGKAMAAGCLKVIGNCMQFNWTGGISYDEAKCFCENFGGDTNQQYNENCVKEFCQIDYSCPSFTLEGSDTAPTTLQISGSAACIKSVSGGQWSEGSSIIYVPNEGCGTKNVCATDICGNTMCKEVRMATGWWSIISLFTEPYLDCVSTGSGRCNAGSVEYNIYDVCNYGQNTFCETVSGGNDDICYGKQWVDNAPYGSWGICEYCDCLPSNYIKTHELHLRWIC